MKFRTLITAVILTMVTSVVQTNQQCESGDGRIGWCTNLENEADNDACGDGWQISEDLFDDCPENVAGQEDVSPSIIPRFFGTHEVRHRN